MIPNAIVAQETCKQTCFVVLADQKIALPIVFQKSMSGRIYKWLNGLNSQCRNFATQLGLTSSTLFGKHSFK